MKEAGNELYEYLTGNPVFSEVMGARLYPLIAPGDVEFPFGIYSMYRTPASKDGDDITFTLTVYFKPDGYDGCVDFLDAVKPVISETYQWLDDTVEVLEDSLEFIGTITFKT